MRMDTTVAMMALVLVSDVGEEEEEAEEEEATETQAVPSALGVKPPLPLPLQPEQRPLPPAQRMQLPTLDDAQQNWPRQDDEKQSESAEQ